MAITPTIVSGVVVGSATTPVAGTPKVLPVYAAKAYTFISSVQYNPLTLVGQIYPKLK